MINLPTGRKSTTGCNRADEVALTRLRIEHLIERTDATICHFCNSTPRCYCNTYNIIEECPELTTGRCQFNVKPNIKEALGDDNEKIKCTINLLKHLDIFRKI